MVGMQGPGIEKLMAVWSWKVGGEGDSLFACYIVGQWVVVAGVVTGRNRDAEVGKEGDMGDHKAGGRRGGIACVYGAR